ncbi:enoyl-CoA hydratase/isomerase family protein [Streptomyces sp. AA1529]|uniref:enoyl-CoA hydratase/isomerase family protein n=1 Tax=Streptomyces sp. AA1529 TaxID=1203257 RepID=UPI0002DE39AA|nr:enoyl-CoA hydratase/isomerase family protein [Streptomyces sp. AA1529]
MSGVSGVVRLRSPEELAVAVRDDVAVLTLSRPEKLNALSRDMRRDLAGLLRYYGDGRLVRGVVVTGRGRAFSAGMDLREATAGQLDLPAEMDLFNDVSRAALGAEVPVVAAVNGLAVGGAGELALSFDARVAAPSAGFVWPENGVGLTVSNAASLFLPRLAGASRALDLLLSGARVDARQGRGLGLFDDVVETDALVPAAVGLIHRWNPPGSSTAAHLRLLRPSPHQVEEAMARESAAVRQVQASGIARAGLARALAGPAG